MFDNSDRGANIKKPIKYHYTFTCKKQGQKIEIETKVKFREEPSDKQLVYAILNRLNGSDSASFGGLFEECWDEYGYIPQQKLNARINNYEKAVSELVELLTEYSFKL
jgi:hypothetical protein